MALAYESNTAYQAAEADFLKHAKETINPALGIPNVREMLLQHILTEEIFPKVFEILEGGDARIRAPARTEP